MNENKEVPAREERRPAIVYKIDELPENERKALEERFGGDLGTATYCLCTSKECLNRFKD